VGPRLAGVPTRAHDSRVRGSASQGTPPSAWGWTLRELDGERGVYLSAFGAAASPEPLQSPSLGSGAAHGLALNGPAAPANVYDELPRAAAAPAPAPAPGVQYEPLSAGAFGPAPARAQEVPYEPLSAGAFGPAPAPAQGVPYEPLSAGAFGPAPAPASAHVYDVLPGLRSAPAPSPAAAPRLGGPRPQLSAAPPALQPLPPLAQPQAAAAPQLQPLPQAAAAPMVGPQLEAARAERSRALAPSPERLERRAAWHAELARDKRLMTKPMHPRYSGEETNKDQAQIGRNLGDGRAGLGTRYADSPADFGVSLEGGALKKGGATLDSTGSKRMWAKDKDERVNYALDGTGGLHAADARAELVRSVDPATNSALRSNHSSLVGGAEVAAAGTMKVRGGKVEELADDSGHYKPSLPHTHQAFEQLVGGGAMDPMRSTVRLEGKRQLHRGKVDAEGRPVAETEPELRISGNELESYGDELRGSRADYAQGGAADQLQSVEHKIRAAHAPKERALTQLKERTPGGGVPLPSERRRQGLGDPAVQQHWAKMREQKAHPLTRALPADDNVPTRHRR
jgi:hypothetical protein